MKISELMKDITPDVNFEGFVTNDDFVLAVDCSETGNAADVSQYAVAQLGVTGLDSNLNPIVQEKTYIRAGQSSMKTGNQRSFKVSGDRYIGDEFQDFALSHAIKYGTGSKVVRKYVYFCLLNGKGESGEAAIIVNSDGNGAAGESAAVDIELKKSGAAPAEYVYSAAQSTSAGTESGQAQ